MRPGTQHDAADFLTVLLGGFEEILKKRGGTTLDQLMGVQWRQERQCGRCKATESSTSSSEVLWRLHTRAASPVGSNSNSTRAVPAVTSLVDLILEQSQASPLEGLGCKKCGTPPKNAAEQISEAFSPDSFAGTIAIHIQRFRPVSFDGKSAVWEKDARKIQCPYTLQIHGNVYTLVGVVGHTGKSCTHGHYTAMTRDSKSAVWHLCDDSKVRKCIHQPRKGGTFTELVDGSDPYILFYQRNSITDSLKHVTPIMGNNASDKSDSPETQALKKHMNITPKRQQIFAPGACKICGDSRCLGVCMQRL